MPIHEGLTIITLAILLHISDGAQVKGGANTGIKGGASGGIKGGASGSISMGGLLQTDSCPAQQLQFCVTMPGCYCLEMIQGTGGPNASIAAKAKAGSGVTSPPTEKPVPTTPKSEVPAVTTVKSAANMDNQSGAGVVRYGNSCYLEYKLVQCKPPYARIDTGPVDPNRNRTQEDVTFTGGRYCYDRLDLDIIVTCDPPYKFVKVV